MFDHWRFYDLSKYPWLYSYQSTRRNIPWRHSQNLKSRNRVFVLLEWFIQLSDHSNGQSKNKPTAAHDFYWMNTNKNSVQHQQLCVAKQETLSLLLPPKDTFLSCCATNWQIQICLYIFNSSFKYVSAKPSSALFYHFWPILLFLTVFTSILFACLHPSWCVFLRIKVKFTLNTP